MCQIFEIDWFLGCVSVWVLFRFGQILFVQIVLSQIWLRISKLRFNVFGLCLFVFIPVQVLLDQIV